MNFLFVGFYNISNAPALSLQDSFSDVFLDKLGERELLRSRTRHIFQLRIIPDKENFDFWPKFAPGPVKKCTFLFGCKFSILFWRQDR